MEKKETNNRKVSLKNDKNNIKLKDLQKFKIEQINKLKSKGSIEIKGSISK